MSKKWKNAAEVSARLDGRILSIRRETIHTIRVRTRRYLNRTIYTSASFGKSYYKYDRLTNVVGRLRKVAGDQVSICVSFCASLRISFRVVVNK